METKNPTKGLESQDGMDRLKCLGDISASEKQEATTWWRVMNKSLEIHWNLETKNWRNQEDNDLYNQKHGGILT